MQREQQSVGTFVAASTLQGFLASFWSFEPFWEHEWHRENMYEVPQQHRSGAMISLDVTRRIYAG